MKFQAELELAADQVLRIKEEVRLVSTCLHLYAWDGSHFVLVSDFGGIGGLGYWFAPETYPYGTDERYPETEQTIRYRREFNTRRIQAR